MREADKRMYYIVSPNSFAYNPARINVGSIGYQNIGKNVIVSSLYEVSRPPKMLTIGSYGTGSNHLIFKS